MEELIASGKVKDVYSEGDRLRFEFTDKISVFDKPIPSMIPHKGSVLCKLSAFWLEMTKDIIENHFIELKADNEMVVRKFDIIDEPTTESSNFLIPLEFIVRHYMAGSFHRRLTDGRADPEDYGIEEVEYGMKLPRPVFDVTTKFEKVDRLLDTEEALRIGGITMEELENIKDSILRIDSFIAGSAVGGGLIHVDGKKEFAMDADRNPVLVDTFGTPDEDRFWDFEAYAQGEQIELSKEFVRKWYIDSGYHQSLKDARSRGAAEPPIPGLPNEMINKASELYVSMYKRLTGEEF